MRPLLPAVSAVLPYLERIDAARYYSNHGPLVMQFESRLGAHFNLEPAQVATVVNGTTALSAALLAVGARPGSRCLLPSWTFVASAAAVWAAHLVPHFVDVSPNTWMLDPIELRRRTDLDDVGAVMVVSAFGAPVDTNAWDDFSEDTGIPVVIDAAAGFDTFSSVNMARVRRNPVMVSFHATKVFGIGEGAVVLSNDTDVTKRIRQVCNFGVWNEPSGQIIGYNGKLSEFHAAVGLAFLDIWNDRRLAIGRLTSQYADRTSGLEGIGLLPTYNEGWVSCYCNAVIGRSAVKASEQLRRREIETRRWWRSGVHREPAYMNYTRDELPVTEWLADRVLGLPFFPDLSDDELARVIEGIRALH